MQNRHEQTLYNVMFPVWMLWLFPLTWLVALPVNFAVDWLVIVLTLRAMQVADARSVAKSVILRVWLMGFVADFVGTALLFAANMAEFGGPFGAWWYEHIASAISFNPFSNVFAALYVTLCTAISALCIYWFNRKLCLRRAALDDVQKRRLALSLAIFTAPYLFYFPSEWIY